MRVRILLPQQRLRIMQIFNKINEAANCFILEDKSSPKVLKTLEKSRVKQGPILRDTRRINRFLRNTLRSPKPPRYMEYNKRIWKVNGTLYNYDVEDKFIKRRY